MGKAIQGINPQILTWARESAGLEIEAVAKRLGKEPDVVRRWEAGDAAPTYVQLEKLAYSIYKRPIALFFFPRPPQEADLEHSFRTMPDFELRGLGADTRYKIREARAFQESLRELSGGKNPATSKIFADLPWNRSRGVEEMAEAVREALGVDLETQKQEWKKSEDALRGWRTAVEANGIHVFKSAYRQDDVSGFCLFDEEFPVISINNSTSKNRQIFTLFHELAHILAGTNGVTKTNDEYVAALDRDAKRVEIFCNRFAAEFLVPEHDLRRRLEALSPPNRSDDELLSTLANEYKVSREVVLRRFLDSGWIDRDEYHRRVAAWNHGYRERRRANRGTGGNYYATKAAYLGDSFLRLGFGRYYQGGISIQELAEHFAMKVSAIDGLEQFWLQKTPVHA